MLPGLQLRRGPLNSLAGFNHNIPSKDNTLYMHIIKVANPSMNNIVAVDKVHSLLQLHVLYFHNIIIQVYLCNLNSFFFFSGIITFSEYLFLLTILMSKLDWNYVQSPMYFSMKLLWSITEFNWLLLDLYGGPKLGRILKGRGREGK